MLSADTLICGHNLFVSPGFKAYTVLRNLLPKHWKKTEKRKVVFDYLNVNFGVDAAAALEVANRLLRAISR